MSELRDDPVATSDAPPPRVKELAVNDTLLYAEIRGDGPAILIITGGARRESLDAEAFVHDDVPLVTTADIDVSELAASMVDMRFAHGSMSPGVFREIATILSEARGQVPAVIEGAGHALYLQPGAAARFVHDQAG